MSNFFIRTLSGIVYAALVMGAIFAGSLYFAILSFLFLFLTTREYVKLASVNSVIISSGTMHVLNGAIFLLAIGFVLFDIPPSILLLILILPIFVMIYILLAEPKEAFQKTVKIITGMIYLSLPSVLMVFLFYPSGNFSEPQIYPLIGLFAITWISDSMAYISGSLIGRTKLIERLSPKKTWEGTLGGLLFSLVGAWILSLIFIELNLIQWLGFALVTVIFGTFGDLFESMLKRNAGVKESGNIIPGHGGALDRLDSLLFASPIVYLYLMLILNL